MIIKSVKKAHRAARGMFFVYFFLGYRRTIDVYRHHRNYCAHNKKVSFR
jgi:hypothetical protein